MKPLYNSLGEKMFSLSCNDVNFISYIKNIIDKERENGNVRLFCYTEENQFVLVAPYIMEGFNCFTKEEKDFFEAVVCKTPAIEIIEKENFYLIFKPVNPDLSLFISTSIAESVEEFENFG